MSTFLWGAAAGVLCASPIALLLLMFLTAVGYGEDEGAPDSLESRLRLAGDKPVNELAVVDGADKALNAMRPTTGSCGHLANPESAANSIHVHACARSIEHTGFHECRCGAYWTERK
jgi:hypothetical protein